MGTVRSRQSLGDNHQRSQVFPQMNGLVARSSAQPNERAGPWHVRANSTPQPGRGYLAVGTAARIGAHFPVRGDTGGSR
jgi:hypothetical protein